MEHVKLLRETDGLKTGKSAEDAKKARVEGEKRALTAVARIREFRDFPTKLTIADKDVEVKTGELIGPKGKTINAIQDETGADISIEEDGTVYIGATDGPSAEAARAQVNAIANPTNPEVGEQYLGTVVKLATFGAFVSLLPGKDGLLHISEVRKLAGGKRVENVEDVLEVGQKLQVEITKIDDRGKLSLAPVREGEESGGEESDEE